MAVTLIQAGNSLQFIDSLGAIQTLSLPSGVSLRTDIKPRFQIYNDFIFVVGTPTVPLTVDVFGTVRSMVPKPPTTAPVIAAGGTGGLSGTYDKVRVTFIIKDANGNVISESDFSPASDSVTISSKNLKVTSIPTSTETISARRLYRPTTGGTTLFHWIDVDGNTVTEVQDDLADASLSIIAAPTLGNPPRLTLIKEWRNLLWGVGDVDLDTLHFSRPDAFWSWPLNNTISIPSIGEDRYGIRALMPRRDSLGVGRRDVIWQVTGTDSTDFTISKLSENVGIESQDTAVVYRDTFIWLWKDGVYRWDDDGIESISDPSVSSWFNTGNYFNQSMFSEAFAHFDQKRLKYRLFLASAGSSVIDRWIEYDMNNKTWWGPHKTDAFTPTSAFNISDDVDRIYPIVGSSSGFIWKEQLLSADDNNTPIDLDIYTKYFGTELPDYEKYWGEVFVQGKQQSSGVLKVIPRVGSINSKWGTVLSYEMTKDRQRLGRCGTGKLLQLDLTHKVANEPVEIYGLEIPYNIIGRR